jgi:Icc-related predicted phosphoesterase
MRICATSDFHGYLPDDLPESDLLLIAGDVCPMWNHDQTFQYTWLRTEFSEWLSRQYERTQHIVGIAGNHDFALDEQTGNSLPWTYLQDTSFAIGGIKIHGSPWTPRYGKWAYMKPDVELNDYWDKIPFDVDILMVHGPFDGYGDVVSNFGATKRGWNDTDYQARRHVGSRTLANKLHFGDYPNLRAFVCGHIHEGYGTYAINDTLTMYNVAYVSDDYIPGNPPKVFDIDVDYR